MTHAGTFVALGALLLGSTAFAGDNLPPQSAFQSTWTDDVSCGAKSLRLLCGLEGVEVRPGQIEARLGPMPDGGHNLRQLVEVSRSVGLKLEGVRLTYDDAPPDGPVLVHLNVHGLGHFVVIRPVAGQAGIIEILDPSGASSKIPFREIVRASYWTNAVLRPMATNWANTIHHVGWLPIGSTALIPLLIALIRHHDFFARRRLESLKADDGLRDGGPDMAKPFESARPFKGGPTR